MASMLSDGWSSVENNLKWKIKVFQTNGKGLKDFLYFCITAVQTIFRIGLAIFSPELSDRSFLYLMCR